MPRNTEQPHPEKPGGLLRRRTLLFGALGIGVVAAGAVAAPRVIDRVEGALGLQPDSGPVTANPAPTFGEVLTEAPQRVASFGPNGTHWPQATPWHTGPVDYEQVVECSWEALSEAITTAVTTVPEGETIRLLLKPGTLDGYGAGSRSEPTLANVGSLTRSSRILVYPRDGYGTVTVNDSWRWLAVHGVAFAAIITAGGFLTTGCSGSAFARMKVTAGYNVHGMDNVEFTEDVELVEVVVPESQDREQDVSSFRTPTSDAGGLRRVTRSGCYTAPAYKPDGSNSHCDTLQMSGQRGNFYGEFDNIDCADFASTNAAVQIGSAADLRFDHCLVLGGDAGKARYPLLPGSDRDGNHSAFNGAGQPNGCVAIDSIFIGPLGAATWSEVKNSSVLYATTGSAPTSGDFTVDPTLANWDESDISAICPAPTDAYLASIWV
jgi:hypothetical protein